MSASIRFLGFAVLAWAGVRAASLGLIPGTEAFAPPAEAATTSYRRADAGFSPPAAAMPPVEPLTGLIAHGYGPYAPPAAYPGYPQPIAIPVYYPIPGGQPRAGATRNRASGWNEVSPTPRPLYEGWGLSDPHAPTRYAATTIEPHAATTIEPHAATAAAPAAPVAPGPAGAPLVKKFDRLQLSAWALLRGSWGPGALATGGTLGGSQVGGRLIYQFTPSLAASLRSSSSVGGVRYAEVAGGVRWRPVESLPVALNFERRHALNRWGGRNAFAFFAEGGLYQTPMFGLGSLDLYAQGGVVGLKSRDLFVDGAATFTRPLWRRFSAGLGVWGGAQPGLYRVDAGPRLSYDVGRGIRIHADYRQRLAGEAMPASGPALTIAGDF